jgi:hypothetical protein
MFEIAKLILTGALSDGQVIPAPLVLSCLDTREGARFNVKASGSV